jgi:cytochrome c oxidase subunit III
MSEAHRSVQYETVAHQADTAMVGMWLFLGTEVLFFGGLFLAFAFCRMQHPHGFVLAGRHTELAIGTVNTVLLITSSATYAGGLQMIERGSRRGLLGALGITAALAAAFLALKGFEWSDDISKNLFPGPGFGLTGPDAGGAQLFFSIYFVATGLHGVHMLVGLGLLAWLALRARTGTFDHGWVTPVEVVGLYWSFVDMVWLILFPLIYLVGRAA